ncbi:exodeoxyribonuclease VII small subunit [Murinocardiopsis flavida]|uniref:Exodeoxyribonuclease 7 small subunit n=1 Tax=Murinocardiopsis flavida TaxID=645275 RepID=A0A2P8DJ85_9ACTN|nr:exodeoxyribonuclease VII small subunit [Murinocardiopsis flavida]PSK97287.1 exodeoxyribonuclease VII small subunit [Murinocardiopsis flavida]
MSGTTAKNAKKTGGTGGTGSAEEPEPGPELSYEEAREELATVVRTLESGGLSLKESLALWERGEKLATTCEQWLEGARAKLAAAMAADEPGDEDGPAPF